MTAVIVSDYHLVFLYPFLPCVYIGTAALVGTSVVIQIIRVVLSY